METVCDECGGDMLAGVQSGGCGDACGATANATIDPCNLLTAWMMNNVLARPALCTDKDILC